MFSSGSVCREGRETWAARPLAPSSGAWLRTRLQEKYDSTQINIDPFESSFVMDESSRLMERTMNSRNRVQHDASSLFDACKIHILRSSQIVLMRGTSRYTALLRQAHVHGHSFRALPQTSDNAETRKSLVEIMRTSEEYIEESYTTHQRGWSLYKQNMNGMRTSAEIMGENSGRKIHTVAALRRQLQPSSLPLHLRKSSGTF